MSFIPDRVFPVARFALLAAILGGGSYGEAQALQARDGPRGAIADWTLTENLRFPVIDPSETAFPDVRDVVVDAEGRLFLGLFHLRSIRAFDAEGRFLTAFGSPGSEPGQMADLRHLGRLGDTLVAIDRRRAVFFGPDGTPRGDLWATRSLTDPVPRFERLLPDGRALFGQVSQTESPPGNAGEESDEEVAGRLLLSGPRDGSVLDTLVWIPAVETPPEFQIERDERTMGWRSPYTFEPLHHIASNGLFIALVDRPEPDPSSSGEAEWELMVIGGASGDTLVHRRYPYAPRPVDADGVVAALAEGFASAFGVPAEELEPEVRRGITLPATAPPLTEVHAADNGEIWLRMWHTPGAASRWQVLDPEGAPVSRLELPAGSEVLRIENDAVYATVRDGAALELVRYRIVRGGG